MSEQVIFLVPTDPSFEPTLTPEAAARAALDAVLPSNVDLRITSQSHDAPRLFDAGKNFSSVACPHCSTNISLDWWAQKLEQDFDGSGFKLATYWPPCCDKKVTLNELIYQEHQAFGRYALVVKNCKLDRLSPEQIATCATALGTPLSVVYQAL